MIDKQEVMDFSREFGLSPQVIEKDFTLGWLLATSQRILSLVRAGLLKAAPV